MLSCHTAPGSPLGREDLAPVGDVVNLPSLERRAVESGYVCLLYFSMPCGYCCAELVGGSNVSFGVFARGWVLILMDGKKEKTSVERKERMIEYENKNKINSHLVGCLPEEVVSPLGRLG